MRRPLLVHLVPSLFASEELTGGVAVVFDVLRATTTIVHALAAGARDVIPCLQVEDARAAAARFSPGQVVLGGERGGLRIDGFDLGNSPAEYTPQTVGGKTLLFTTTNGTKAIAACRCAQQIALAALVNLSAVRRWLESTRGAIHLVCAGTRGTVTREDVLAAGLLAAMLEQQAAQAYQLNDSACLAADAARHLLTPIDPADRPRKSERLLLALRESLGGRDLIGLGLDRDLEAAAQLDRFDLLPEFDSTHGSVHAATSV